ncbi:MAG: LysR family transcriptional regulator [Oleiphilaceae bacterium]|nr:LysR family transcriptional regulator [Oleiphilaceae bacterium]
MDKLRALQYFVRLADLGSFTRVAEQSNVTKSMVSKEIAKLEENLGARLLHRTTRKVQLTHAGQGYLERARLILDELEAADSQLKDLQNHTKGKLRINAPMALGLTDLSRVFAAFMQAHPEVELDIHLSDEPVDLVEKGYDLGFRASSRPFDSNYVGRPLARFAYKVCVAPDYLKRHTPIDQPADLSVHNCFVYSYFQGKNMWPLDEGVRVSGTLRVNSTVFMLEAIKQGRGIGFIPDFVCREALAKRDVVEILQDVPKPDLTLYAIYPARHYVPPVLTRCVRFIERWFEQQGD